MSFKRFVAGVAAALAMAAPCAAAPLAAYGGLPSIEDAALSPNAARVALMVTEGDTRRVIVKRISDGVIEASVQAGTV